jgi:hypothetical protein
MVRPVSGPSCRPSAIEPDGPLLVNQVRQGTIAEIREDGGPLSGKPCKL